MTFSEYRQYDALGLAELVRQKEITAAELLELAIGRAEQVNPSLNAIIHQLYDHAREQLENGATPSDSPFAGVPFLVKDLGLKMQGAPTRDGSRSTSPTATMESSYLVRDFEEAGLLIFGKTN